ncbi:unnamed protein product [Moneuplotes crassus]|uniref:Uncharacterized protein n=1 Tax=Euplotes crassus TaxID=5936 RepID=A0AAD1Y365_EUPCR|nr:unnamed protein product [Moneuplotes crassus]
MPKKVMLPFQLRCLALGPLKKTKSDSQMVNSKTPSKLNQSQTAFNFAVGKCLKPVEEEDKSKSSEKEEFQPFNQEYLFGKEYRESFKKSKYKMMPHKPGQPENISDERCSEGPIARNCVYEFAPRENTVLFKKGSTRPPF